mmetsp:Transcript_16409/g.53476  ORF Transcript_16409/g.53476 Transcript_16409/m.53476 type:complete len:242 (-) Transcript_16409:307-1032(-)
MVQSSSSEISSTSSSSSAECAAAVARSGTSVALCSADPLVSASAAASTGGLFASAARHLRSAAGVTPLSERSSSSSARFCRRPAQRPLAPASLMPLYLIERRFSRVFVLSASPSSLTPRSLSAFQSRLSVSIGQSGDARSPPSARAPLLLTAFQLRSNARTIKPAETPALVSPSAMRRARAPPSVRPLCARLRVRRVGGRAGSSAARPASPSRVSDRSRSSRAMHPAKAIASALEAYEPRV